MLDEKWRVVVAMVFVPLASWGAYAAAQTTDPFAPVFTKLSAEQVMNCVGYLEARGIPFEIRGDGCDLWAPVGARAELKIELAQFTEGRTLSAAVNDVTIGQ